MPISFGILHSAYAKRDGMINLGILRSALNIFSAEREIPKKNSNAMVFIKT